MSHKVSPIYLRTENDFNICGWIIFILFEDIALAWNKTNSLLQKLYILEMELDMKAKEVKTG